MKGNVKYGILRVTYNNSNPIFSKVVIEGARITHVDDRGNIYGNAFEFEINDLIFVTKNFKDMDNLHLIKEPKLGAKIEDFYVHYIMDSGYLVSKSKVKTRLFLIKKDDPRLLPKKTNKKRGN